MEKSLSKDSITLCPASKICPDYTDQSKRSMRLVYKNVKSKGKDVNQVDYQ